MASLRERAKTIAGLLFALVCVVNLVIAVAWGIYTYAVTPPAREQLATTHADMIGRWEGSSLRIEITPDAMVSVNDGHTHYGGKIWRFHDRDFSLWVFPVFPAHFRVEKPAGEEMLVVDGKQLMRRR